MTSELRTKKGESSLPKTSFARASGPAVRYMSACELLPLIARTRSERFALDRKSNLDAVFLLELAQQSNHDFRSVVDSEYNILDAGLHPVSAIVLDRSIFG